MKTRAADRHVFRALRRVLPDLIPRAPGGALWALPPTRPRQSSRQPVAPVPASRTVSRSRAEVSAGTVKHGGVPGSVIAVLVLLKVAGQHDYLCVIELLKQSQNPLALEVIPAFAADAVGYQPGDLLATLFG
jgi:hypothetical protein